MARLHIAEGLSLPLDATTQAIGIVAKRRVGKSYTARRFAEQFLNAGQQVVIADPKGDWWGIRSSADGKAPGFPVVILGGEHGDVPLEKGAGEIIAKMVVEERVSCLLDLSQFRKREVAVFMADFLETLYRLKAKEALRTPLMMIIDEADAIAPQKPQDGEERMLGAAEDIVRRGGQRGIGCMMITQRTAVLNKNVLTQCEMLVALRTISPQDLKAMQAWIDVHGTVEERDTLMASLPSLPQGDAWFWSPGWPTADGIFKRVHVSPIETFDSGATPKSGEKRVEPKTLADVDIPALQKHIASTIERAKADDPKELRREIAHLKGELTKAQRAAQSPAKAGQPVVDQRAIDRAVTAAVKPLQSQISQIQSKLFPLTKALGQVVEKLEAVVAETSVVSAAPVPVAFAPSSNGTRTVRAEPISAKVAVPQRSALLNPSTLSGARLKIARALAELHAIGVDQVRRAQLAFYTGLTFSGGYGSNTLGAMRTEGLIDYPTDGFVELTDAGVAAAGEVDPPTSLHELHERVRRHLSGLSERIFDAVVELGRDGRISRDDLAAQLDVTFSGGYGSNTLGALRTAGIVDYPDKGSVGPSDLLFPEALS